MVSLSNKQRKALPQGLPLSAHRKLLEKCGILALFHLVHEKGDREKIDALRQFADCQVNLIAQADLVDLFHGMFEGESDGLKKQVLDALAQFWAAHDKGLKITQLRTMEDVIGDDDWDTNLVVFCKALEKKNPEAYKINLFGFAQNTDVTLSKDVLGAIGNWTVDYNWPVYADEDKGKPKDQVTIKVRRPELKKEASELARAYTLKRLGEHTSKEYQDTPFENNLRPWNDVADQVHALLPRITDIVQQKNGPDVEIGSALLEVLAWLIVTCREGRNLTFNVRRRKMTPANTAPAPSDTPAMERSTSTGSFASLKLEEEDQRDEAPQVDKLYRSVKIFTLVAVPNEERTDFIFHNTWDDKLGNVAMGFVDVINYYNFSQEGSGLSSANLHEFENALMTISPVLLILPTLVLHPPHTGLVTGRNSPQWPLYEEVSPPLQKLAVTRTSFQGLTLGKYDSDRKQASVYDLIHYGGQLGQQYNHWCTMEYSFPKAGQCFILRTDPIDAALRHLLMTTPNEARRHAQAITDLQKRADETGAVVGGFVVRINGVLLPLVTEEDGNDIAAIKGTNNKMKEYKNLMHNNGVFTQLAEY